MSYMSDLIRITRGLISDLVEPYTYSDERLEEIICISATLIMEEVQLKQIYTVDLSSGTITPAPSNDFAALICLKTACVISNGEHRTAANGAVIIKDGPSTVDTEERAKHLGDLATTACSAYERAKLAYQVGDGSVGNAIVSPYGTGLGKYTFN